MNSADNETSLHWSEEKEVVSTNNALKFLLLLLKITPRWFVHFLVLPVGFFYFLCSRRGRTECRLYQNQLKEFTNGAVPKRVSAYNQIESFSLCIVERMEGWLGKYRFKDLITHDDDLAELIERLNNRQGAILIGSHLGCIEFLRSLSYQDSTGVNRSVPVLAIMKTGATEQFNKTLNEINPGSSLNLIDPSEITPDTMIQMQELIENGGLVVFTADRTSEGSRSRCIRKNFLGKPADFPYAADITEIDGFDNLHHPQGILKRAQERAARVFGADRTYFLVGGSTVGMLAAITAAAAALREESAMPQERAANKPCGEATGEEAFFLAARNCHRSVYHAFLLNRCSPVWLYPPRDGRHGFFLGVSPKHVETLLEENPSCRAVVVTSPTYEGVVSDIARIAETAHGKGALLIVDEAHGAHFGFHAGLPQSAIRLGADIVVQSLHKTLPSPTQTALLHICGERVDARILERCLDIFQTSSPSYPLLMGIDACVDFLCGEKREKSFDIFLARRRRLERALADCADLYLLTERELCGEEASVFALDPCKLVLASKSRTGTELSAALRTKYHLETEMSARGYALAIMTPADTEEGWERLEKALVSLDADKSSVGGTKKNSATLGARQKKAAQQGEAVPRQEKEKAERMTPSRSPHAGGASRPAAPLPAFEAILRPQETVPCREAEGRLSADCVTIYPPGIPLALPGERLTGETLEELSSAAEDGAEILGAECRDGEILLRVLRCEK